MIEIDGVPYELVITGEAEVIRPVTSATTRGALLTATDINAEVT